MRKIRKTIISWKLKLRTIHTILILSLVYCSKNSLYYLVYFDVEELSARGIVVCQLAAHLIIVGHVEPGCHSFCNRCKAALFPDCCTTSNAKLPVWYKPRMIDPLTEEIVSMNVLMETY